MEIGEGTEEYEAPAPTRSTECEPATESEPAIEEQPEPVPS